MASDADDSEETVAYDPVFVLPLLMLCLEKADDIDLRTFVELDCLSVALMALSAESQYIRAMASHVLDVFHRKLTASNVRERLQISAVLTGLVKPKEK